MCYGLIVIIIFVINSKKELFKKDEKTIRTATSIIFASQNTQV